MKRLTKVIIIYFVVIGGGGIVATTYHNFLLENITIPGEVVIGINLVKMVDVDKKKLFITMADVENYPKILPNNILSVEIVNQTQSFVKELYVKEKVFESGVTVTLLVKHSIVPYDKHIIEIEDGDAKGTKITINFREVGSKTEVTTEAEIRIHGILSPFGLLARPNLESAINTVIDDFVDYAKNTS